MSQACSGQPNAQSLTMRCTCIWVEVSNTIRKPTVRLGQCLPMCCVLCPTTFRQTTRLRKDFENTKCDLLILKSWTHKSNRLVTHRIHPPWPWLFLPGPSCPGQGLSWSGRWSAAVDRRTSPHVSVAGLLHLTKWKRWCTSAVVMTFFAYCYKLKTKTRT